MRARIQISNYRCFAHEKPATIDLVGGETAIVGANNAGKSTLLKFFFELRSLFAFLSGSSSDFLNAMKEPPKPVPFSVQGVSEWARSFTTGIPYLLNCALKLIFLTKHRLGVFISIPASTSCPRG
jgi:hypothetical protein